MPHWRGIGQCTAACIAGCEKPLYIPEQLLCMVSLSECQHLFASSGDDKRVCRLEERGSLLSDDVKKNQKIASETARAASAFNRVWVGKESEVA